MDEMSWYNEHEAQEIADCKDKPMIIRILAQQYLQALTKKDMTKINEIISYQIPKPKQDIGIDATQPLIVFKSGQESDVEKVKDQ